MRSLTLKKKYAPSLEGNSGSIVAKLLWFELFVTVFLDTANELLGIIGVPLVLGQVVRSCFLLLNLVAILEFGKRKESQAIILIYIFFALMILREATLGLDGMAYAAVYWAKFLLYVSTFFAVRCTVMAGRMSIFLIEKFFKWSIYFIAPAFLALAMMGFFEQSSFDSGYEGAILTKNSMSATLLMLLAISMFLAFRGKLLFLSVVVIAIALLFLGSKSTIAFGILMILICILHELKGLTSKGLLTLIVLLTGIVFALWLYRDSIVMVIDSQIQRYQYVMNQQNGSFVDYLLTGRNDLLEAGLRSFTDGINILDLIIGSGISTLSFGVAGMVDATSVFRGVEMDTFEIVLASGIVGLAVTFVPFVLAGRALKRSSDSNVFYLGVGLFVITCFMTLGGHVVTEGMSSSYLGVYLAYICLLNDFSDSK